MAPSTRCWLARGPAPQSINSFTKSGALPSTGRVARTNRATPIAAGDPVRVVAIEGLELEVEPEEGGARDYRDRKNGTALRILEATRDTPGSKTVASLVAPLGATPFSNPQRMWQASPVSSTGPSAPLTR